MQYGSPEKLYSPREVMDLLSIGQTRFYELCKRGQLRRLKIGASTRIPSSSLAELQATLSRKSGQKEAA